MSVNAELLRRQSKLSHGFYGSWTKIIVLSSSVGVLGFCVVRYWGRLKPPGEWFRPSAVKTQEVDGDTTDCPVHKPRRSEPGECPAAGTSKFRSKAVLCETGDSRVGGMSVGPPSSNGEADSGFDEKSFGSCSSKSSNRSTSCFSPSPRSSCILEDIEEEDASPVTRKTRQLAESCKSETTSVQSPSSPAPIGVRQRADIHLPTNIVGRFIGRQGKNIKSLMDESGAQIHVQQQNVDETSQLVPCIIQGKLSQIVKVLDLISSRHPEAIIPTRAFRPDPFALSSSVMAVSPVHLLPTLPPVPMKWDTKIKGPLMPATSFLGIVTHVEDINQFWLVTYSTTKQLDELNDSMAKAYFDCTSRESDIFNAIEEKPSDEEKLVGKYCAARISEIHWLRGKIMKVVTGRDQKKFKVLLVDYGSSALLKSEDILPLRRDYATLPAQAVHCQLAYIEPYPIDPATGGAVLLQSFIEAVVLEISMAGTTRKGDEEFALVDLYFHPHYGGKTYINRELVKQGYARWRDILPACHVRFAECESQKSQPQHQYTGKEESIFLSDLLKPMPVNCPGESIEKESAGKEEGKILSDLLKKSKCPGVPDNCPSKCSPSSLTESMPNCSVSMLALGPA